MLDITLAVGLVALACGLAMRAGFQGTLWPFAILGTPYLAMSVLYIVRLWRQDRAKASAILRPRSGDLSYGFLLAGMLFVCVLVGRSVIAPAGSIRESWLTLLYMHVGEPSWAQKNLHILSLLTGLMAVLEEIAWRGYILSEVNKVFGVRSGWPITAALNAVAYMPTLFLAGNAAAGPNPLVVLTVLACALAWGFVVARTNRLPVAVLSHALFAWAVIVQFPLWRLAY